MLIDILISIIFYFILVFLSINLLGFFVRGFFIDPELNRIEKEGADFLKEEVKKIKRADVWANIAGLTLILVFLYCLAHFWNVGVMAVALIIMAGRLPDLIWEIKNGKKMTRANAGLLPKNILYYISTFLPWLGLPLLYYFLYGFK